MEIPESIVYDNEISAYVIKHTGDLRYCIDYINHHDRYITVKLPEQLPFSVLMSIDASIKLMEADFNIVAINDSGLYYLFPYQDLVTPGAIYRRRCN